MSRLSAPSRSVLERRQQGHQAPPTKPAAAAFSAPVELQANRNGTWHTLLEFDAASEAETHYVQTGVERLATVDRAVAFRVVSRKHPFAVLQVYSTRYGWTVGRAKAGERP